MCIEFFSKLTLNKNEMVNFQISFFSVIIMWVLIRKFTKETQGHPSAHTSLIDSLISGNVYQIFSNVLRMIMKENNI